MASQKGTALITGASLGLGREYAGLFAADGCDVVLVARGEDKLRALAADLEKAHGVRAHVIPTDLGAPGAAATVVEEVRKRNIEIEYLVNNAGFATSGVFAELDVRRELEMVQVNIATVVHLTRLFLPLMIQRGHGRVLNVASTAAFESGPFMATYYASKAFVLSFSEAVAHEARGTGVTVTVHCPGPTATEFARTAGTEKSLLFRIGAADAAQVARHGYRAMRAGRVVSIHGIINWFLVQSVRFSPRAVIRAIAARLNRK